MRERQREKERQREVGKIVSARQSSFLLFSAVQSCVTKTYFKTVEWSVAFACVCAVAHDSYKHTAICIPEWSEPDLSQKTPTLCLLRHTFLMSPTNYLATI